MAASKQIHHIAIGHIVRAPSSWLAVTPLGRILSTLGGDLGQVDAELDTNARALLGNVVQLVAALVIVGVMDPWILITLVVAAGPSYLMIRRYLPFYRDGRALDAWASRAAELS